MDLADIVAEYSLDRDRHLLDVMFHPYCVCFCQVTGMQVGREDEMSVAADLLFNAVPPAMPVMHKPKRRTNV